MSCYESPCQDCQKSGCRRPPDQDVIATFRGFVRYYRAMAAKTVDVHQLQALNVFSLQMDAETEVMLGSQP